MNLFVVNGRGDGVENFVFDLSGPEKEKIFTNIRCSFVMLWLTAALLSITSSSLGFFRWDSYCCGFWYRSLLNLLKCDCDIAEFSGVAVFKIFF